MKPSTALIRELAELATLFDRLRADGLRRRNLTLPRRRLLMFLHESGRLRSSELAQRLAVTPRAVTALVDGLVDSGYVERRPDPSDRRATFVELTDSGTEICSDMQKSFDSFAAQLFAGISPGDVEAAVKTIAVIRKNFEQMLAP